MSPVASFALVVALMYVVSMLFGLLGVGMAVEIGHSKLRHAEDVTPRDMVLPSLCLAIMFALLYCLKVSGL